MENAVPAKLIKPVVLVNPENLQPLPKELWGTACSHCDKPTSRWEFIPSDPIPVAEGENAENDAIFLCSACFLYESNWGTARRAEIDDLVQAVEKEMGTTFSRNEHGMLVDAKDANRILGAIALTSRMFEMRNVYSGVRELAQAQNQGLIVPANGPQFERAGPGSSIILPGKK